MKIDQLTRAKKAEVRKECEEIIYWGRLLVKAAGNPIEITYENETPDADVAPVVHAHWIDEGPFCSLVKCSQCGNFLDMRGVNAANFCPHCGAKMDEEER